MSRISRSNFMRSARRACRRKRRLTLELAASDVWTLHAKPKPTKPPDGLDLYICPVCHWLHWGHSREAWKSFRNLKKETKVLDVCSSLR